jgi:hypothetical protein
MRVIKELTISKSIKCTLFSWNGKYLIKLEQGNLEQTYKIPEIDLNGLSEIENLLSSPEFSEKAVSIFSQMDSNLDSLY